ncbi:MAG: DUF1553 domain-containing protein [Lentisphaeria bacterium]|nr:DUF1553 domain-containing protein [Lentisphaeria bacterium]
MRCKLLCVTLVLTAVWIQAASPFADFSSQRPKVPAEISAAVKEIDSILEKSREQNHVPKIPCASDAVFLRRAWLCAVGKIPTRSEVNQFLNDKDPAKRAKLIDRLLASEEHADLIAMRFADMLRIKSEFPVNLWPNAVHAFHQQLRTDIFNNRPYSEMAFEMLTASGSNFRIPYANFFRGSGDRTPAGLAKITALTFMGLRVENLKDDKRKEFENFFSRIRYKSTSEWKEEFVFTDPEAVKIRAWLPGVGSFTIHSPEEEPRLVLAHALVSDDNPYFARAFVNRAWSWFFGKGLIDPADDISPEPDFQTRFLRSFGFDPAPPGCKRNTYTGREIHPKLLDFLTEEFRRSHYDMRHLFRLIMNCQAFHASPVVPIELTANHPEQAKTIREQAAQYFLTYPVRRLEAEVLSDCLGVLTGYYGKYSSVIPEPFTYLPSGTRAIQIADGSISSAMLGLFGRPSRDSGQISDRNNHMTASQRLYLLNSNVVYRQISNLGWRIGKNTKWDFERRGMQAIYLTILGRPPTPLEKKWIRDYQRALPKKQRGQVWPDLCWVLVNSKEFLYYH